MIVLDFNKTILPENEASVVELKSLYKEYLANKEQLDNIANLLYAFIGNLSNPNDPEGVVIIPINQELNPLRNKVIEIIEMMQNAGAPSTEFVTNFYNKDFEL